jgi:hypothetical protein
MAVPAPARLRIENLPTVFPNAAGLDIGSSEIVAALPPDRDGTVVRTFTTFTATGSQILAEKSQSAGLYASTSHGLTDGRVSQYAMLDRVLFA